MLLPRHRRKLVSFLFLQFFFLLTLRGSAQWNSIGNIETFETLADGVEISAPPARLRITIQAPDVVRVRMTPHGSFLPDSSWAVVHPRLGATEYTFAEQAGELILTTTAMSVHITRNPCRITFYDGKGNLLNRDEPGKGMGWSGREVAVWKTMPQDERYYGFGEKAGALERRGTMMSMWNSDIPAYRADTDPLYESIPFFYGVRTSGSYGIFFDNTYFSWFNMGKEHPEHYSFGAADGELNYYFFAGPTPRDVLGRFSSLIGTMPMPPRWALGYQQCRWSYYPESRVREIAANFRTRKIPCDVLYLDIHYMDGYRVFTWDSTRFPQPGKMVSDLLADGFKTAVIIDPGIKQDSTYWVYRDGLAGGHFVEKPDGTPFLGKVWPGVCAFPDYTRTATQEWWGSLFKGLIATGIRGYWVDMNEPSVFDVPTKTIDEDAIHDDRGLKTDHRKNHNIYGMQMARSTYEGTKLLRPTERPFVLTRANYAGGNRYSAAWTGDNISSWEHLEMAVPMCLNISISGQPFIGSDIGGFIGTPSGELYARWLQLGIFTPLMRSHAEINSPNKEPWEYGKDFEDINRASIELRYHFLPYIYTQTYLASATGIPMMRPFFFQYPNDSWNHGAKTEFLFGDDIIVAPVLWERSTTRSLRLPEGEWYDYWTGKKYAGATQHITIDAPLDRLPLFVRSGAIIPTQQPVQYSDQAPIDPLTFEIYPSARSSSVYYEDDGISFDFENGTYFLRRISVEEAQAGLSIVLETPEGSYTPPRRDARLKINARASKPSLVQLDGKPLRELRGAVPGAHASGWIYDENGKTLWVQFPDASVRQDIRIK